MFLKGCLIELANSLASWMSSYSAFTSFVPRIFSKVFLPFSFAPLSIKLLGVSGRSKPPTVIKKAGNAAKPKESLHPHGSIFCVP
ncbi:hypothetical protein IC582_003829 [Cucumis melo]